jgi:D-beta-D-heptose 7-phosphate kinase/D-beta-D-heptose 1-phosphate adenosyltransferase
MADRVVLVTGGFDPLHSGHIAYFKSAAELGSTLVVGLNSDDWLINKKGKYFMPWEERAAIITELRCVDRVISFNDSDKTAIDAIRKCLSMYPNAVVVFANGGDRVEDNIPEMQFESPRVEYMFGIGGSDKKNSSSWILEAWKANE